MEIIYFFIGLPERILDGFWEIIVVWPVGTIAGSILALMSLVLMWLIIFGPVFRFIDSWRLTERKDAGIIVEKTYVPRQEFKIPQLETCFVVPDDWSITVEVQGRTGEMPVSKEFYHLAKKGAKVKVGYLQRRITGRLDLRSLTTV